MKEYGIIKEYDGYCGIISGINNIDYLLLKKDILYENVVKGDIVIFTAEELAVNNEIRLIARFVEKK